MTTRDTVDFEIRVKIFFFYISLTIVMGSVIVRFIGYKH